MVWGSRSGGKNRAKWAEAKPHDEQRLLGGGGREGGEAEAALGTTRLSQKDKGFHSRPAKPPYPLNIPYH